MPASMISLICKAMISHAGTLGYVSHHHITVKSIQEG